MYFNRGNFVVCYSQIHVVSHGKSIRWAASWLNDDVEERREKREGGKGWL
jgi:hypothetical protein